MEDVYDKVKWKMSSVIIRHTFNMIKYLLLFPFLNAS